MNKLTILMCLTCFSVTVFLSACATTDSGQMVNYKRKFQMVGADASKSVKKQSYGIIDLSDGQKVNFDAPIGPSFDIQY